MNTIAWIVINAVLLGSAVASVKLAKDLPKELKQEQQQLLTPDKHSTKKAAASKEAAKDTKTAKNVKQNQPEQRAPQIRMGTLDDIWKKSLFNPRIPSPSSPRIPNWNWAVSRNLASHRLRLSA